VKKEVCDADTGPVTLTPSLDGRSGWSRILVIDDDRDIGYLVQLTLEAQGYEVVVKEDGLRGLAAAQHQRPDAIVLDLMMPVMDGYEVLRQLRSDQRTNGVPVVVLTAVALKETAEELQRAGASACLTKPFAPEELSAALSTAIATASAARNAQQDPADTPRPV
jgi:CheY-like chemotaxis protein